MNSTGSGTTIIAGEMTGRCVHALELRPAYVDAAVIRWQSFTGKVALLREKLMPAAMARWHTVGDNPAGRGAGRMAAFWQMALDAVELDA